MNVRPIRPLANARDFKCNEMFFSMTDLKGCILSSNEVFVRVSGFERDELYGRPHNIIRHPDMPRAAFATLWTNLKQGKPFAGYVKNMAKDGSFYWVFVVVVPTSGSRYLSIRFKPSSPLLDQVESLYKRMLTAENAVLAEGGKEQEAVAAGARVIVTTLQDLKVASYDLLSHTALNLEMKSRDAQLRAEGRRLFPQALAGGKVPDSLAATYAAGVQIYDQVDQLFRQLDGFVEFTRGLEEKAIAVLDTAEVFRVHALNVKITSDHHGAQGGCVGVVAGFLDDYSRQLTEGTVDLRSHIAEIARGAETINARVAMARLQLEMHLYFQAETATRQDAAIAGQMEVLEECFITSTTKVLEALSRLRENLPRLFESRKTLARTAMAIEMTQVCGLTETARMSDGEGLRGMFSEFRTKIGTTRGHLDDLSEVIEKISWISSNSPRQVAAINTAISNATQRMSIR